ncbi:MAG: transcriptional regulator [Deltaproteobacteria bacterium]|nr:transcriptional regulator [Deltaproteobacteria bacterium]
MSEPKVIKRYANRKLYDTERSCYVTLDEIALMIKDGEEVQVIDNKTKDDLTAVTLAQILVEEEKKVSRMPLKLLRGIIQNSNDTIGDLYQRFVDPLQGMRGDVERRVSGLFKKEDEAKDEKEPVIDEVPAPKVKTAKKVAKDVAETENENDDNPQKEEDHDDAGPVRAFVAGATSSFEALQRKIDERVKESLSAMTHLSQVGIEMSQLLERLERMEERLERLDGQGAKKTEKKAPSSS